MAEKGGMQAMDVESGEPKPSGGGFWSKPFAFISAGLFALAGVVCLVLGLAALETSDSVLWVAGAVGLVGSVTAGGCICAMGGMKRQLDRFRKENDRLQRTSTKLDGEVGKLETTNKQLGVQVDKLEDTVDDLQNVSEGLQKDLEHFGQLRESMEDLARETGMDIKAAIGNVNSIYDKIYGLTLENERALLQRIAQDLEFLDRDAAMSKIEFERFLQRIPVQFRTRFQAMNLTFEDIAGEDKQIDFKEMGSLIDKLMQENCEKKEKHAETAK